MSLYARALNPDEAQAIFIGTILYPPIKRTRYPHSRRYLKPLRKMKFKNLELVVPEQIYRTPTSLERVSYLVWVERPTRLARARTRSITK